MDIWLNDLVIMKKSHACGTNKWHVVRVGADIGIVCEKCRHKILMKRVEFIKKLKKIEHTPNSIDGTGQVIINRLGE